MRTASNIYTDRIKLITAVSSKSIELSFGALHFYQPIFNAVADNFN
jgi:hypothetical protein